MIVCITKPNFHDIMHKIIVVVKFFFKGMGLGWSPTAIQQ